MNLEIISDKFFENSKLRDGLLSKFAIKDDSSNRKIPETQKDLYRSNFQIDRDRIIHTNSFRRLKHKSQVFVSPVGDHYTTRLTHVIEVSQIGRTIARALSLNEDLVEAASLGHDLGHTPFGHIGESVLNEILREGFHHSRHSIRIIEKLEKKGKGLNLTNHVIEAIRRHSKGQGEFLNAESVKGMTLEAQIVRISDALAYLSHDIEDAKRSNFLDMKNINKDVREFFTMKRSERINIFVSDVVLSSWDCSGQTKTKDFPIIAMSKENSEKLTFLRNYMFENFYLPVSDSTQAKTAYKIVETLFHYYKENINELPNFKHNDKDDDLDRLIADYICGMTDHFATRKVEKIDPGISKKLYFENV